MDRGTIAVGQEEWAEAEAFFKANANEIKFRKSKTKGQKKAGRSFVKIDDVIYALNNTSRVSYHFRSGEKDIAFGSFGRVKFAVNQKNEVIAIKVTDLEGEFTAPKKAYLKSKGFVLGQAKRAVKKKEGESGQIRLGNMALSTKTKVYTAMPYFKNEIAPDQAYIVYVLGLSAMMEIEALHREGYIHRDIKENNFLFNKKGDDFTVMPADFDFLLKLPEGKKSMKAGYFSTLYHTPGYNAPEILKNREYSIGTDTYALGKMLDKLGFPEEITQKMMDPDPKKRGSISEAMEKVVAMIKEQFPEDHPGGQYPDTAISLVLQKYEVFCKALAAPSAPKKEEKTPAAVTMLHKTDSAQFKKASKQKQEVIELLSVLEETQKLVIAQSKDSPLGDLLIGAIISIKDQAANQVPEAITLFLNSLKNLQDNNILDKDQKNIASKLQEDVLTCMKKIDPHFALPVASPIKKKN